LGKKRDNQVMGLGFLNLLGGPHGYAGVGSLAAACGTRSVILMRYRAKRSRQGRAVQHDFAVLCES